jgi:hypothetical protein
MAARLDYLRLAVEAEDSASGLDDMEIAASYRRLAASYAALAEFQNDIADLLFRTPTLITQRHRIDLASARKRSSSKLDQARTQPEIGGLSPTRFAGG